MRRGRLSRHGVGCRSIHQVDIEPAIVVVVKKTDTGALRFNDEFLFRRSGDIPPFGEPGLFGYIVEHNRPRLYEATGRDRTVQAIEHRGLRTGICHFSARRLPLLRGDLDC